MKVRPKPVLGLQYQKTRLAVTLHGLALLGVCQAAHSIGKRCL
jgi:hypothetical protein